MLDFTNVKKNYEPLITLYTQGRPKAYVIKLFTMVIYHHSMVMPSFWVEKLYCLGDLHGMAVDYNGKKFYNIGPL
jgi:hypothetical protein